MLEIIKKYKLLYILGLVLLGSSLLWNFNQSFQLSYVTPKVQAVKNIYAEPVSIAIERINLHLEIYETEIKNNTWSIAPDGVSHLNISARPGENGAIIMYGHNTNDRLGPIRWLVAGDKIQIKSRDGKIHNYIVEKTFDAKPDELGIFANVNKESLMIYTCDGFADLKRFVLIGKPEKIEGK